jgi:hypothetical protein
MQRTTYCDAVSCAHHTRALASKSLRVWPVASEMRHGVFSEWASQTLSRDLRQRSCGDSSQAAKLRQTQAHAAQGFVDKALANLFCQLAIPMPKT